MNDVTAKTRGRVRRRVPLLLAIVASAVLAVVAWEGLGGASSQAQGLRRNPREPLDAGAQRLEMIEAQKKTNVKLDQLLRLLQSGKVKVTVVEKKPTAKATPAETAR